MPFESGKETQTGKSLSKRSQNERLSPRLEDVAQLAGVSTATVSRVLNHPESVTPQMRQIVQTAVDTLGYIPHGAARALATRRSNTVGAVIPTIDNAIFARCIQAFQDRLFESGFTLLLASSDYNRDREQREVHALVEHGIDGLLLIGEIHEKGLYDLLQRKQVPYINTWTYREDSPHPCVGFDNEQAAYRLTSYLLDIGHTNIAMVAGITEDNDRALNRVQGVKRALKERGFNFLPEHYNEWAYEISEGRKAVNHLLATPTPPTAIVCGNDILALGVLFECLARGIDVPAKMSITGFDGLDLAGQVAPPLTTVHIPSFEMGRRSAEYLVGRLNNRPVADKTKLESSLVIRNTTAPPSSQ